METLRFLMVTTSYPPYHLGGDARFVEYLSRELVKNGHEVHVLHSPAAFELIRKEKALPSGDRLQDGVNRHVYRSRIGSLDTILSLSAGSGTTSLGRFRKLARALKPDVIHWHNTKGFIGRPISVAGSVNLYTAHDFYAVCPRSNLLRPGPQICNEPRLCQICLMRWRKPPQFWRIWPSRPIKLPPDMTTISPSKFVAQRLSKDGIVVNHILSNFVPDLGFQSAASKDRTNLLYAGLLEVHKGPQTLFKAFERTIDLHGFQLWILGEGALKEGLRRDANMKEVEGRVHVPGFRPLSDMQSVVEKAAAMVVPSECYENVPLAALEALSMGIPVIASDLGGLPEIVGTESGSMTFPGGNVDALAERLVSLWNNREEINAMGRKARKAYETRHTPATHIKEYCQIIAKVTR